MKSIIKWFIMVMILVGIGSYSDVSDMKHSFDIDPIQPTEDPDTDGMG